MPSLADYRIEGQLGSGTYGKVYKVRRLCDDAVLVLKQVSLRNLSAREQEEALNESRLMATVEHHPRVIRYHESFMQRGYLNIIMDYAEGGDLAEVIERKRAEGGGARFAEPQLWQWLIQVCEGLRHLHSRRILHRDIKPANVFVGADGDLRIGDLGLGRQMGPSSNFAKSAVGTPLYFSPELCEEKEYNEKSDVWTLGCLLFELANLRPPFVATNQLALARRIVHERPTPPRLQGPDWTPPRPSANADGSPPLTTPPTAATRRAPYCLELNFLALKMLEKDPGHRPTVAQVLGYAPVRMLQMEALETERQRRERQLTLACDELRARCAEQAAQLSAAEERLEQQREQLWGEASAAYARELSDERERHQQTKAEVDSARATARQSAEAAALAERRHEERWRQARARSEEQAAELRAQLGGARARAEQAAKAQRAAEHAHRAQAQQLRQARQEQSKQKELHGRQQQEAGRRLQREQREHRDKLVTAKAAWEQERKAQQAVLQSLRAQVAQQQEMVRTLVAERRDARDLAPVPLMPSTAHVDSQRAAPARAPAAAPAPAPAPELRHEPGRCDAPERLAEADAQSCSESPTPEPLRSPAHDADPPSSCSSSVSSAGGPKAPALPPPIQRVKWGKDGASQSSALSGVCARTRAHADAGAAPAAASPPQTPTKAATARAKACAKTHGKLRPTTAHAKTQCLPPQPATAAMTRSPGFSPSRAFHSRVQLRRELQREREHEREHEPRRVGGASPPRHVASGGRCARTGTRSPPRRHPLQQRNGCTPRRATASPLGAPVRISRLEQQEEEEGAHEEDQNLTVAAVDKVYHVKVVAECNASTGTMSGPCHPKATKRTSKAPQPRTRTQSALRLRRKRMPMAAAAASCRKTLHYN